MQQTRGLSLHGHNDGATAGASNHILVCKSEMKAGLVIGTLFGSAPPSGRAVLLVVMETVEAG